MPNINVKGVEIDFPFQPYDVQTKYMEKVVECLQNKQHGVLESPTGTGKTLCLLCSTLSWLTAKKAQVQAQALVGALETPEFGGDFFKRLKNQLDSAGGNQEGAANVNPSFGWSMPKIIYASRTHTQLTQVMQELKRTSFKHVKVAVIGSRDQLCIHPEVSSEQNSAEKIHLCQAKVRSRSCMYYNNVEVRKDDPVFRETICDIEDLVKAGNKMKCCPYFLARELKQSADITFMPYNYLLDPKTRRSQGIDLQNHVILLDEAHNVEKTCEDAASLQISSTDVALCIEEVTHIMKTVADEMNAENEFNLDDDAAAEKKDFTPEDLCVLKTMFLALEAAIDEIVLVKEDGQTYPGSYMFELLEKIELTPGKEPIIAEKLDKIILWLSTTSTSPFARRGRALQKFADFLRIVYSGGHSFKHRERVKKCYKVFIQPESEPKQQKNDGWNTTKKPVTSHANGKKIGKVISYWCFSPGFGMQQLEELGVHSIILTSGTLSPLKAFISELGISIGVQLENPHIVKPDQVCVGILSKGPDGHPLNSSFNTRNDPKYIATLGRTIYNFSCLIPDGLLVFFPSYPIMKKCRDDWQMSGLWTSISQRKQIYVETQSKENFNGVMNDFYTKIQDPNAKGAIFLAVCRGKVSEGLDFADANGRAVLITGLPYPPMMDPRVKLKQVYLEEARVGDKNALSGQQWYQLEASRAVNQAIGRIIRHIHDYGAIIFCDCRFANASFKDQLSAWLRPQIKNFSDFGVVTRELRGFFKNAQKFPQPKMRPLREEFSLPTVGASFPSQTRVLETSSVKSVARFQEEKFDLSSYKKYADSTKNSLTVKSPSESGNSNKGLVNFATIKAQGSWSASAWAEMNETSGESVVKRRKLNVQPVNIDYSREKITDNQPGKSLEDQDKKEVGANYLKAVKKSLSKENFQIFAKVVESYKKTGNLEELLNNLEKLFPIDGNSRDLFYGFKTFLKKHHISNFDAHLNSHKK